MKKLLPLLLGLFLLSAGAASAQYRFNYSFSVQTGQPYTAMTGEDTLNGTMAYNDIILGWLTQVSLPYDGQHIDTVWIMFENLIVNRFFGTQTSPASGFQFTNADLTDKGFFDSTETKSPVHFALSGAAPARILKIEMSNMGFADEHSLYGTLNDYANIQFWVYENSGVVELRYGPSQISHFYDYFPDSTMQVGLYSKINFNTDEGMFYYLSGNPSSPTIDSAEYALSDHLPALTGWPAPGTVYRFTPRSLGVGSTATAPLSLTVSPSVTREELKVDYGEASQAAYSIVSQNGAVVQRGTLQPGRNGLDVSALPAGTYVLLAKNAGGFGAFRFVKL